MNFVINNLKKNILPLIFTILGVEIILYSYLGKVQVVSAVIIFVLTTLFFILYDYVDVSEKGVLIYLLAAILVIIVSYISIAAIRGVTSEGFRQWLFNTQEHSEGESFYCIPLAILLSFIFSSMYYYFTVKIIRMPVLLLLIFVDLILYIRGPYKAGNVFICLYLLCFIFMFIKGAREEDNNKADTLRNTRFKDTFLVSGGIILIALIIGLLIPKNILPHVSCLDGLKAYFRELNFSSYSNDFNVQENTNRTINNSVNMNNDEVLYTYKGEKVEYLVTHTFDFFNTKKNMWQRKKSDYKLGYAPGNDNLSVPISKTEKTLESSSNLKGDLGEINEKNKDNSIMRSVEIEVKNGSFKEFTHPSKTYGAMTITGTKAVYLNGYEQFFNGANKGFSYGDKYEFMYMSDTPEEGSKEDSLLKYFNEDRYEDYLKQTNTIDNKFYDILDYYTRLDSGTSDKLIQLAKSITKDKVSYYDKAKAIEDYFHSGKYKYNLKIKNTNKGNYIDYFIFDSKEGYCVQYATAMTIMCRAAGLPARYCEGFLVRNEDKVKDGYEVNAMGGHAFTEVYIPGYGWKIFDATPADLSGEDENSTSNNSGFKININSKYILIVSISIVAVIGCTCGIILILKLTERKRKIRKILKKPKEEALEGIIKYSVILLNKLGLTLYKEETMLNFAKRVDNKINIGFLDVINNYYLAKYSGTLVKEREIKKALDNNEKIYEALKSKK